MKRFEKKSFMMYLDNKPQFDMLTDEQAGKLIKAVYTFAETGEEPDIADGMVRMAFCFIAAALIRDLRKYQETCKKNAKNGRKGGRPRKDETDSETQKTERFFKKPKKADSDSGSVSDSENDRDRDSDSGSESDGCPPEKNNDINNDDKQSRFTRVCHIVESLGFDWTAEEFQSFYDYNELLGWKLSVKKAASEWERNRNRFAQKHGNDEYRPASCDSIPAEEDKALEAAYLAAGRSWMRKYQQDGNT